MSLDVVCPHCSEKLQVAEVFRRIFPSVYEQLEAEKSGGRNHYKSVAHRLQRAESEIVIADVCAELFHHEPDIQILTVHDSLLVKPQFAELVKNALKRRYWEKRGVSPRIKIDGERTGAARLAESPSRWFRIHERAIRRSSTGCTESTKDDLCGNAGRNFVGGNKTCGRRLSGIQFVEPRGNS